MKQKKWIKTFALLGVCSIAFVGGVNYLVDPYGYNNFVTIEKINKYKYSNTSMTARFKTNILTKGNFEAIMLGTSRIGVMDPNVVEKYLGLKTFNLEYPGSNAEIHNRLFFYAEHFNEIKYLIYGIDFMAFNENRTAKNDFREFYDLQHKIENFQQIDNYELYFNLETFVSSFKLVLKNILGIQKVEAQYLFGNGMRDYANFRDDLQQGKLELNKNIEGSIKSYFKKGGMYKEYKFSYQFLDEFQTILSFCKANNIELIVYIPPMYSDHFDAIAAAGYYDEFEQFKKEFVKITNFVDFTGRNTISEDKNNYWDSSHLRKEVTSVVMARLFSDNSINIPQDFGILVTKDNINEHLENLKKQVREYDLNTTLSK